MAEKAAAEPEEVEAVAEWEVKKGRKGWPEDMAERRLNPLNYGQEWNWQKLNT